MNCQKETCRKINNVFTMKRNLYFISCIKFEKTPSVDVSIPDNLISQKKKTTCKIRKLDTFHFGESVLRKYLKINI